MANSDLVNHKFTVLNDKILELEARIRILEEENGLDTHTRYEDDQDELFLPALKLVSNENNASASFLQRKLNIGYARAARILDQIEENGFVSPQDGAKPRVVKLNAIQEYLDSQGNSND